MRFLDQPKGGAGTPSATMTAHLTLDDTDARAAAEELRTLVGEGDQLSRYLRERIASMLGRSAAVELVLTGSGLSVQPSTEMLSILATLRAHGAVSNVVASRN